MNIILEILLSSFPKFDPNWHPDTQDAWFNMFVRILNKIETNGGRLEPISKDKDELRNRA